MDLDYSPVADTLAILFCALVIFGLACVVLNF